MSFFQMSPSCWFSKINFILQLGKHTQSQTQTLSASKLMWRAGSSLPQTGPGEASWDEGNTRSSVIKTVISSLPPASHCSQTLTPLITKASPGDPVPPALIPSFLCMEMWAWWEAVGGNAAESTVEIINVLSNDVKKTGLWIDSSVIWTCQSEHAPVCLHMCGKKNTCCAGAADIYTAECSLSQQSLSWTLAILGFNKTTFLLSELICWWRIFFHRFLFFPLLLIALWCLL